MVLNPQDFSCHGLGMKRRNFCYWLSIHGFVVAALDARCSSGSAKTLRFAVLHGSFWKCAGVIRPNYFTKPLVSFRWGSGGTIIVHLTAEAWMRSLL